MVLEISILSLNVWGIPFISHHRESRMKAIGEQIIKNNFDIVSLQEVWSEYDFNKIKQKTETVLPFSHYFHSGVIGSGLCVLSKHPIITAFFHAWPVNGYFHRVQHADWFGGKGVGLCQIIINGQIVNVYNAHLHAEYDKGNDEYKTHRVIQGFDTGQFIENTRGSSILQILAGDLNTQPGEISYRIILRSSKMIDCCIHENIGTNECSRNSFTTPFALKNNPRGLRIDHIFARTGDNHEMNIHEYKLPFPDRVPGQTFSFSDHEAIYSRILISCNSNASTSKFNVIEESSFKLEDKHAQNLKTVYALQEGIELCETSLKKLKTDRMLYYVSTLLLTILLIGIIDYSVPYGFKTLFLLIKFIIISSTLYTLFMSTIWNRMEKNGILSGKHSMKIALKKLENLKCE